MRHKIEATGPIPILLPHDVRLAGVVAYPGWRWRVDESGTYHHEKIPNPILRFLDWAWRGWFHR